MIDEHNVIVVVQPPSIAVVTALPPPTAIVSHAGIQGPPGPRGEAGGALVGTVVAAVPLTAGDIVYCDRATRQLGIADAVVYTQSFVLGFVASDCAAGFAAEVHTGQLAIADWTRLAGTPHLLPGLPYFLRPGGGITSSRPTAPASAAVAVVGVAVSPSELHISPTLPIQL